MQEDIVPDEDDIVHGHKLTVINGEVVEELTMLMLLNNKRNLMRP
jgi:hypothetical protein